jgi:hypothetical protein
MPHPPKGEWLDTANKNSFSFGDIAMDVQPVYHPEVNRSYRDGITDLQAFLADTLKKSVFKDRKNLPVLYLRFAVTWNGTVSFVDIKKDGWTEEERKKITAVLHHLPHSWSPATGMYTDMDGKDKHRVKLNALVSLDLKL